MKKQKLTKTQFCHFRGTTIVTYIQVYKEEFNKQFGFFILFLDFFI